MFVLHTLEVRRDKWNVQDNVYKCEIDFPSPDRNL